MLKFEKFGEIKCMNYYRKLSESAFLSLGLQLTIRTLEGWGWRLLGKQNYLPPIYDSFIRVKLISIHKHNQYRDSAIFRINDSQCVLNEETVTAIPWCDGENFDFQNQLCYSWVLFFGSGTVSFDEVNLPIYSGDNGIQGWGFIAISQEVIRLSLPQMGQLASNGSA